MSFNFTREFDKELKEKDDEVKALVDQLSQPSVKIEEIKIKVNKIYDEISLLEASKERITKRFSLGREQLLVKVRTIE